MTFKLFTFNAFDLVNKIIKTVLIGHTNFYLSVFSSLLSFAKFNFKHILLSVLVLYLVINITLTGFDLSSAILRSAYKSGLWILNILAVIVFP